MKRLIIFIVALMTLEVMSAQNHFVQVLRDVEAKSPMLKAAQTKSEAQQAAVMAGTLLEDPSIEAAYFWGDPVEVGKRWDLSISQSFDMPSVYVRRGRLRKLQQEASRLDYQVVRKALLSETQKACSDVVYYRAVGEVYSRRLASAQRLVEVYEKRLAAGDCSILEYNRAKMNLADIKNRVTTAAAMEDCAMRQLSAIVGEENYQFSAKEYESVQTSNSFESWYKDLEMQNPELQLIENEVDQDLQEVKLASSRWLPTFELGYASENVVGETFRGVKVGLTLPIFSQPRSVKAARIHQQASEQELSSRRIEYYNRLKGLFLRHQALEQNCKELKETFALCNSEALLEKALQAGEMSLETYLLEIDYFTDVEVSMWDAARELEEVHIDLYSLTL